MAKWCRSFLYTKRHFVIIFFRCLFTRYILTSVDDRLASTMQLTRAATVHRNTRQKRINQ